MSNIVKTYKILKGNTRISILFEPLWGVPFVLYNFYLSLYMKELGVTDRQLGYLIFLGFFSGTFFSLIAGVITDKLGRRKTTLIFDLISWPGSILIYIISNNFWMFAAAVVVNSVTRIVAVSWNMMVVEDADNEQRVAAFNLLNIITIATGVIIPVAGILVNLHGVVYAERIFLVFAAISMTIMMISRHIFYKETKTGVLIIAENKNIPIKKMLRKALPHNIVVTLIKKPASLIVVSIIILFNIYLPLATINSLYFAPYMTEVLSMSKSSISILGGVFSAVLFVVLIFINPIICRYNKITNMIVGLLVQATAIALLTLIYKSNIIIISMCIVLLALGFGIFKPFIDSLLAEVTEGKNRAGVYSIVNAITCIATALVGLVSGGLYELNPRLIYYLSVLILLACSVLLFLYNRTYKKSEIEL